MSTSYTSGERAVKNTPHLAFDLVCFSHLRWNFVYQRPQHLLSRCAREHRVFFIEEPEFSDGLYLDVSQRQPDVWVVVPHLPHGMIDRKEEEIDVLLEQLLNDLLSHYTIHSYVLWYYTPMALSFSRHLTPLAIVYDCMDELSAFQDAPSALRQLEAELFERADIVFTGGQSLYEAKCKRHPQVHAFPSSVDTAHFARARGAQQDPADQASIDHPRLGFYGVLDERFDVCLLSALADAQPDWQFIIIGPVAKIDAGTLPRRHNIHYLGQKTYDELPAYLAGWDVAILPFAHNDATRFISPTKTLEYLAAGKPVISTSIRDVVKPYGQQELVSIADTPDAFITASKSAFSRDISTHLRRVDTFLSQTSWDATWSGMRDLIEKAIVAHQASDWILVEEPPEQYIEANVSTSLSSASTPYMNSSHTGGHS